MKKILFLFLILISMSCSNEVEETISEEFLSQKFVGNTVAYLDSNNAIKLGVSNTEIMKSFNNYSNMLDLGFKAHSLELLEIENKHYLRFYNDDKSVSTVALINDKLTTNTMKIGGTVCTTISCANCCGCVPNGDYCTDCTLDSGDCKRTTSS
jgi:hypothetical protein